MPGDVLVGLPHPVDSARHADLEGQHEGPDEGNEVDLAAGGEAPEAASALLDRSEGMTVDAGCAALVDFLRAMGPDLLVT